jgi:hypothetical protein
MIYVNEGGDSGLECCTDFEFLSFNTLKDICGTKSFLVIYTADLFSKLRIVTTIDVFT